MILFPAFQGTVLNVSYDIVRPLWDPQVSVHRVSPLIRLHRDRKQHTQHRVAGSQRRPALECPCESPVGAQARPVCDATSVCQALHVALDWQQEFRERRRNMVLARPAHLSSTGCPGGRGGARGAPPNGRRAALRARCPSGLCFLPPPPSLCRGTETASQANQGSGPHLWGGGGTRAPSRRHVPCTRSAVTWCFIYC